MNIIEGLRNNKQFILSLIFTGWILDIADRSIMGFSVQLIGKDLQLSPAVMGMILSSFYFGYAIMQVPAGWFADRYGAKASMLTSITLWSAFAGLTAMAWSATSMMVVRFLFGCCQSGYYPGSAKTVAQLYEKSKRGRVQSLIMASNPLGVAVAPLLAVPLIGLLGWRGLFLTAAAIGLVLAVIFWVFMHSGKNSSKEVIETPQEIVPKPAKKLDWITLKSLLTTPIVWQLTLMWFGISTANKGLTAWLPSYLLQARHLNLKEAGIASSLPFIVSIFAMLVAGWLMDKFFENREKYLIVIVTILASVFLYLTISSASIIQAVAFQIIAMAFIFMGFAIMMSFPLKVISQEVLGSGNGIIQMGGQAAGIVAPSVMGFLVGAISYDAAFWYLIAGLMLACIIACTIRQRPRTELQ